MGNKILLLNYLTWDIVIAVWAEQYSFETVKWDVAVRSKNMEAILELDDR